MRAHRCAGSPGRWSAGSVPTVGDPGHAGSEAAALDHARDLLDLAADLAPPEQLPLLGQVHEVLQQALAEGRPSS